MSAYECDGCGADVPPNEPCRCLTPDNVALFVRWQRKQLEEARQERDLLRKERDQAREELRLERQAHGLASQRMERAVAFGEELQERVNRLRSRAAAWKRSAKRWRALVGQRPAAISYLIRLLNLVEPLPRSCNSKGECFYCSTREGEEHDGGCQRLAWELLSKHLQEIQKGGDARAHLRSNEKEPRGDAVTPPPVGAAGGESRVCPRCGSPDPMRHPAVQFEGEVQICSDPFHAPTPSTPPATPLPAWRRELERLRGYGLDMSVPAPRGYEAIHDRQRALESLDKLRAVVESGKGEAEVPESVARHLGNSWCGHDRARAENTWIACAGICGRCTMAGVFRFAIDAAGAEIVGGK